MGKFSGKIGFLIEEETSLDSWSPKIMEKHYFGDVLRFSERWQSGDNLSGDIVLSNTISIIANPFFLKHVGDLKYVTYLGTRWNIQSIDMSRYPRVEITLNGIYNGTITEEVINET